MFSEIWIVVATLLVFIGLVASHGLFLILGSLLVIITLAARLWDRYAFRRVEHARSLSRDRAFIGDSLEYTVTLVNDKLLPLIWVDILDPFPNGLELSGGQLRGNALEGNRQHSITTSLLPYQKASWKYTMKCASRGYHRIGPVRLRSGDIFGFTSGEANLDGYDHVLVYPQIADLNDLLLPILHPLGQSRGKRPLHQDTTWFSGQRDYHPTDPMKHIHWKGTAKRGSLQTKVFDPVVSLNVLIAMNATTSQFPWQGSNRTLFERTVTAAASVASFCDENGCSYGLFSNAVAVHSSKWLSVPMGASPSQLSQVLESLARAGPYAVTTLAEVIRGERDSLPAGATVVLVTSVVSQSLADEVEVIRSRGHRVLALYAGNGAPETDLPGVEVIRAGRILQQQAGDGAAV